MKSKSSKSLDAPFHRHESLAAGTNVREQDLKLARHQAQCHVCRHPQREALEQDYIDWVGPRELAQTYNLASDRAIYRHVHALGLVERRRANFLGALDRFIERVGEVKPTPGAIVSAIRLSAQLTREPAATSGSSAQGIVLSFAGMPESDAVRPRHDAEQVNRLDAAASPPPQDDSPHPDADSGKDLSRDRKGANSLGHPPHAGSDTQKPTPAAPISAGNDAPGQNPVAVQPNPPQVAGRVWPWPPRKRFFARRAVWPPAAPGP